MELDLNKLHDEKGQTTVEYLLLLGMTFVVAFVVIRGPLSTFTRFLFANLNSGIGNMITHAEWSSGQLNPGQGDHPANPGRLKPLHL